MNGIIINDILHEPSNEELQGNKCNLCSLSEACNNYYCQLYGCNHFVSKGLVKVTAESKILNTDFVDERFRSVFDEWLEYKKSRKEKYKSEKSLKIFYKQLLKLSNNCPIKAQDIIYQSMANNWAGIFALKNESRRYNTKGEVNANAFRQFADDFQRLQAGTTENNDKPY